MFLILILYTLANQSYMIMSDTVFEFFRNMYATSKGQSYLLHVLYGPMYNVVRAEDAAEILQSTKLITKSLMYTVMKPFMGESLITSTG